MSRKSNNYDYIIVGAGSAGCVLANRLTENPDTNVLLVEAGPADRDPMIRIPLLWMQFVNKKYYDWDTKLSLNSIWIIEKLNVCEVKF